MSDTPVTMKSVARQAGVSLATVSLALRSRPGVSEAEARRIRSLAATLGYRPNPLVGIHMGYVRRNRSRPYQATLGLVTTYPTDIAEVYAEGARRRAEALGYRLERFSLAGGEIAHDRLSAILRTRGIPGVVIVGGSDHAAKVKLEWECFAAVTLGYSVQEPNLHRACHSHFRGMTRVLEVLTQEGCRQIGYVARPGDLIRAGRLQHAAFLEHFAALGREAGPILLLDSETDAPFQRWLEQEKPDAVISADSRVGRWLRAGGQRARFASICLAKDDHDCVGIEQDYERISATAVDLIVGQLFRNERGIPEHPMVVLVEGRWCDRRRSPE